MRYFLASVGLVLLLLGIVAVAAVTEDDGPLASRFGFGKPTANLPPGDPERVSLPMQDQPPPTAEPICRLEEVLAKFKPGADPDAVAARHGTVISSSIPQIGVYVLDVPAGTQAEKVAALAADPDVEYAEPNGVVRIQDQPPAGPDSCAAPRTATAPSTE